MPQFGEMLRELREERRLTQIELANAMHISSSSISAYEIGASLPPMERALELADFFGDLLADEPDFRHRLISVLSRLSTDEWELLERMAQKLVEEEQKEKAGP